jgi:hypothetical protein
MEIVKRSLNWLPRQSMYEEAQQRRAQRREAAYSFIATQQTLASAVSSAYVNYTMGMAEITGQTAANRVNKVLKYA